MKTNTKHTMGQIGVNDFTKGPCYRSKVFSEDYYYPGYSVGTEPDKSDICCCINEKADADLIVAAFNSASWCATMGYDGQKCVELADKMAMLLTRFAQCTMVNGDSFRPEIEKIVDELFENAPWPPKGKVLLGGYTPKVKGEQP